MGAASQIRDFHARTALLAHRARRAAAPQFVLPGNLDQLDGIQQIIQGTGSSPELVLFPHACRDRQEEEGIQIHGLGREEGALPGDESEGLSGKKPSREKAITSRVSFKQAIVSVSISGTPQHPSFQTVM